MAGFRWDPKSWTSRDLEALNRGRPNCGSAVLSVEAFVARIDTHSGMEFVEHEEPGKELVTWVQCPECETRLLDRSLAEVAIAAEQQQRAHQP